MVENSKIEWTDHTFSPWTGCTKVSAACDACYAESWAKRSGIVQWGNHPRRRTSETYWRQPLKWNREAKQSGVRRKVFCASLSDVFDNQANPDWRADLWALIAETPHLDWQLLTKRPQNIAKMLPSAYVEQLVGHDLPPWPWPNVWLGTTVENQEEADRRIPVLLDMPAVVRFLSCEPLLERIDLRHVAPTDTGYINALSSSTGPNIDLVIAGGESGPKRRRIDPDWMRDLRDQCRAARVAFFAKQLDKVRPLPADLAECREFPAQRKEAGP